MVTLSDEDRPSDEDATTEPTGNVDVLIWFLTEAFAGEFLMTAE